MIYSQLPHGLTLQLLRLPPKCIRKAFKNCSKVQAQRTPRPSPPAGEAFFMHTRDSDFWATKQQTGHKATRAHTCTCMLAPACIRRRRAEINFRRRRQRSRSCKTPPPSWGRADFETYAPQLSSAQCKAHMCVAVRCVCVCGVCVCAKAAYACTFALESSRSRGSNGR